MLMRKKKTRIISIILVIVLIISLIPMGVSAEERDIVYEKSSEDTEISQNTDPKNENDNNKEQDDRNVHNNASIKTGIAALLSSTGQCGENVYWEYNNCDLVISGSGKMYDYDGNTSVAPWAASYLKSITICDGVTHIGNYAFSSKGCESVLIADTVTSIGDYAFNGLRDIQTLVLPSSVQHIGKQAFRITSSDFDYYEYDGCTYLGNESNNYVYLVKCTDNTKSSVCIHDGTKFIGDAAFSGQTALTSVTIPDSVIGVGNSAFYSTSVTDFSFNALTDGIGEFAFNNCKFIDVFYMADGITTLQAWSFGNSIINLFYLPKTVVNIEDAATGYSTISQVIYNGTSVQFHSITIGQTNIN